MRPTLAVGDELELSLTKEGRDPHQAVGYLPDGTMIVVNHAPARLGQTVGVQVASALQTSAGRLIFAEMRRDSPRAREPQSPGDDRAFPPGAEHQSASAASSSRRAAGHTSPTFLKSCEGSTVWRCGLPRCEPTTSASTSRKSVVCSRSRFSWSCSGNNPGQRPMT